MNTRTSCQFPYSLNGIEVWAVWGQVLTVKNAIIGFAPLFMQPGMMILGIVYQKNHLAAATATL